jgi:hypothetical protein
MWGDLLHATYKLKCCLRVKLRHTPCSNFYFAILQATFNNPGFQPATGCKTASLCGLGGMLVFMDGPAGMCTPIAPPANSCGPGCIAGSVIGTLVGASLIVLGVYYM